jgi:hypothetical protein
MPDRAHGPGGLAAGAGRRPRSKNTVTLKAEAAVTKAYRVEGRAIRAILDYRPSSASEAVLLLEFAMSEEAIGNSDDLRTVMENASHALRMTI